MKQSLQGVFTSLEHHTLTHTGKSSIYANFLQKRARVNNKRRSLVYKTFAYGLSTLSMIGFVLLSNFFGIFDYKNIEISQSVVAQTIGKIISASWSFSIYDTNNRKIDSDTVQIKDRVVVDKWSTIKILVNDSFTAEIVGPAHFEIIVNDENNNTNYNLKFLQWWDYISIDGVNTTQSNDISVQTSDGVVVKKNQKQWEKTSFAIESIAGNENKKITNKSSASIEITTIDDTNKDSWETKTVIIDSEKIVNISTKADNNKDGEIKIISESSLNEVKANPVKINKKSVKEYSNVSVDGKISQQDYQIIQSNLYKSFIESDIEEVIIQHFGWDKKKYQIALTNLNNRLNRLANVVDIENNRNISLEGLVAHAEYIIELFKNKKVQPSSYKNLPIIVRNLKEINKHEFGIIRPKTGTWLTSEYIDNLVDLKQDSVFYKFQ